jgi:hypothetical protein
MNFPLPKSPCSHGFFIEGTVCQKCLVESLQGQVDFYKQREKDICQAAGGVSDGGQYRNDIIEHLQMQTRQLVEAKDKEKLLISKLAVTLGALDVLPMPFRVMVLAAIETRLKESK